MVISMSGRHQRHNKQHKGNDKRKSVKRKFKKFKNRKEAQFVYGSKFDNGVVKHE